MIEADGTKDKSNFGANAILAVSLAAAQAAAKSDRYFFIPFPWWCECETDFLSQ